MKTGRLFRILSLTLVVALLLQILPQQILAAENSSTAVDISEGSPAASVVGEVQELRSEDTKHFRMSDGSFTAVSYGMPVHFLDENGDWQDINNMPVMTATTDKTGTFQIANANTAAAFASTLESGMLFTASSGNSSVSMSLLDDAEYSVLLTSAISTADATAELNPIIINEDIADFNRNATAQLQADSILTMALSGEEYLNAEDFMPENLRSSILYENVYPGVDILYTAWSYNIKEEIIVRSEQNTYQYHFLMELDGLTPVMNTDNSISLLNEENVEIYFIPAPYMTDSAGAFSDSVTYTITDVSSGFILTVEADKAWINSEDREFPVTIDPSVNTSALNISHSESDDIYSTCIYPGYPDDTSAYYKDLLYTGYTSNYPTSPYITYLYFNDLPEVPANCYITEAKLRMFYNGQTNNSCSMFPIGLYSVTDTAPAGKTVHEWFRSITYNTKPSHDSSNVIDFLNLTPSGVQSYVYWDVTELAQGWYSGEDNRMVALAPAIPFDSSYYSSQYFLATGSYYCPLLSVNYRNNHGLEDYYTYQTVSAGEAGTAYIADATGQLKVVKSLFSHNSDANPFSLNLIYNSDYFQNSTADYLPPSEMGLNMSLGSGWTLDCIQTVIKETIGNYIYLIHRDGDGTVHYYKRLDQTSSTWYDEDGLNLTLKEVGTDSYRLDNRYNSYHLFSHNILTEISDWDRNMVYINYTDGRIDSITQENKGQSVVTLASFTYNDNVLNSITDAAGNVYSFQYSSGKLTAIQKNETIVAQFGYSGYRVNKMTDQESGYSLNFSFDSSGRVSGYNETVGSSTGAAVTVTYPGQGQIVYQDHGQDRTAGNSDDLLHNYLTDYAGRTVNSYTTDNNSMNANPASGTLNIYGASNAVYIDNDSTGMTNNRLLRSASTGVVSQQLLTDTSLESGSWSMSGTSVTTSKARSGTQSLTGTASEASQVQYAKKSSVPLTAGKTYTFSAYVHATDLADFTGKGIYLKAMDSSGNSWTGDAVTYATSQNIDGGWTRLSVTFTAKVSGTHTMSIYREGVTGTFYADDFQLEAGEAPSTYNMVENGGMITSSAWTLGTGASIASGALTITGNPISTETMAYQDIPVNLPGGQTYVLAGWAKANAAPDTQTLANDAAADTCKQFGLRAVITYSDGSTEYHYVPFNADVNAWQFVSCAVIPKKPEKTVSTIRVICAYEQNVNSAEFRDISLIQEVAQSMSYDSSGNLLSVSSTHLASDVNTYSNWHLLINKATAGSGTYYYTYADPYNSYRVSSMTNNLITESYSYNTLGNLISTTLSGAGDKSITTSSTYSADGNRLASVTDAAGATVSYSYDTADSLMTGLPTSVTDPNGTVTSTTYDSFNRITQTGIANTAELLYNYSNGYLGSVSRTGDTGTQSYNFSYDAFGNMTELKVGSRSLATYTYGTGNGQLLSQSYANGDLVSFTYDHLGRAKTVTYPDGTVVTYTYTGDGALYSVTAEKDGAETRYIYGYDSLGRLISSEWKENGASLLRTRQGYDDTNRLVTQSWQLGSDVYTEGFTYNSTQDGSLNTHTTATGQTLTMGYDGLRRLSTITGGIYGKTYTYRDISDTKTTTQVASVVYDLPTDLTYGYTYDILGNIATYTDANGTVTYTYDAQGQLLSAVGDESYTYTYDTVGNILTANGHTYTYGDSVWKDLLTAYDGQSITYDASGNPTSYYNGTRWTFTWANGRRLATATNGTTNLSYTYDTSGLRLSKTVDEVKHSYIYAGGKLLRETYGNTVMDFFYDSNGMPYALKYNGTVYYYITNLQGDVMKLVDASGTVVASYEYDPYGNITSSSGDMAAINPLRYRGYYYDTDSGLYYLQSRYYDPKVGRFINADAMISTHRILESNLYAYCCNNPVMRIDAQGKRSYFINGISNDEKDDAPEYAKDFEDKLEEYGAGGVNLIPVYKGQTNWLLTAIGGIQVILEMFNCDIYTTEIVRTILADLAENPLAEGETINLIGYSGGGQLALNVMEALIALGIPVENVVLIATPIAEVWNTSTKISMLYSSKDLFSMNIGFGLDSYYVGHLGHWDYFNEQNIDYIAEMVSSILK